MNIWIQHADTSTVDVKARNAEEAIGAFERFNWKQARDRKKEISPNESVEPSFGFGVWGDERFLNLVPKDENSVEVLYVKTAIISKKILGIIPRKSEENKQFLGKNLTYEQAREIIGAYFANDEATILKYCSQ